ncbi:protein-L-isoaspartate O-methyltransferase [bacterium]|nr:protein-L-isoaspartate O-methyltransferase [bacterium]
MSIIEQLVKDGYLKTPRIIKAFRKIKRKDFVLPQLKSEAEMNYPLTIGFGQTISQPLTVAFMFELCQPKKGNKVLDIGSGSGWTTALFAEIVGKEGKVYGIERIEELKNFGEGNTKKYDFVSSGRAVFICGDGSKGLKEHAPFDVIHVGAAAASIPRPLLKQLKVGGRLVIPVGLKSQEIVLVKKIASDRYKEERYPGFIFVPLISD